MKKLPLPSLLATLTLLALPFAARAQTVVPDATAPANPPGTPTPEQAQTQQADVSQVRRLVRNVQDNLDYMKSSGSFGAQLWLVGDADFFLSWRKAETPTIAPVQLAQRGQPMYTAIIFYGPARDNKGLANVSYDLAVRRPDGSLYTERKGMVGFQNLAPDERELLLGRNYLSVSLTPEDPAGTYVVEAVIHDNISRVDLPLKQTFVVR